MLGRNLASCRGGVYVICALASHYGVRTRSTWMPVLIGERL
jgi:hypothetical protein